MMRKTEMSAHQLSWASMRTVWFCAAISVAGALMISSDVHAATCRISEVAGATITCGNKVTVKTENDADKAAIAKLAVGSIIEAPTDNIRASDIKIAEADAGGWGTPIGPVIQHRDGGLVRMDRHCEGRCTGWLLASYGARLGSRQPI